MSCRPKSLQCERARTARIKTKNNTIESHLACRQRFLDNNILKVMNTANDPPVFDPGLCRCCGTIAKCRLLNIEYHLNGVEEVYSDMMLYSFGIQLSHLDCESKERLICEICVQKVCDAVAFKKQVLYFERAFQQMKKFFAESREKDFVTKDISSPRTDNDEEFENYTIYSVPTSPQISSAEESNILDVAEESNILDVASHSENESSELPSGLSSISEPKQPSVDLTDLSSGHPDIVAQKNLVGQKKQVIQKQVPEKKQINKSVPGLRKNLFLISRNAKTIVTYSYACPFKFLNAYICCYYCDRMFRDPDELRTHTEISHDRNSFSFVNVNRHLKMDVTRVDCRLCTTKIASLEEFKTHISAVHERPYSFECEDQIWQYRMEQDDWGCVLCDKKFLNFMALNIHMNLHYR